MLSSGLSNFALVVASPSGSCAERIRCLALCDHKLGLFFVRGGGFAPCPAEGGMISHSVSQEGSANLRGSRVVDTRLQAALVWKCEA